MIIEPGYLRSLSFKDLKNQFTKSRGKMQKRKDRLDQKGFRTSFQTFVNSWNNSGKIPTITSLSQSTGDNERQMANSMIYIISELERYAEDPRTLTSYQMEQRRELAEQFNESGYNVTPESVQEFIDFLEWIHNSDLDHILYQDTFEESEKGYGRSKRRKRTYEEKEKIMELFTIWKDHEGYLPEEILRENL